VIDELQITRIDPKYLAASRSHITTATEGALEYRSTNMTDMKAGYLITYVYSRMVLSAIKDAQLISRYTSAEAKRAAQALSESDMSEMERIAKPARMRRKTPRYGRRSRSASATSSSIHRR
jgi:hypothetical protein